MGTSKKIILALMLLASICTIVLSIILVNTSINKILFLDRWIESNYPEIVFVDVEEGCDLRMYLKGTEVGLLLLRDLLVLGLMVVSFLLVIYTTLQVIQLKKKSELTSSQ